MENNTKTIRVKPEKVCDGIITMSIGLMFARKPKTTLFVNRRFLPKFLNGKYAPISLHTFFVFFTIDAYWIDENNFIVHKQTMLPFSASNSIRAKYVLETKRDFLSVNVGDMVEFLR